MKMPFRLNLEQQKKRAKSLLKSFHQQDPDTLSRFEKAHPKLIHNEVNSADFSAKLADAQLVIARELGCKTWLQLRQHIFLMDEVRSKIELGSRVTDEPENCLHIRCGSDIQKTLSDAGFKGEFLEFSDPFCVGPVQYDYDIEARAGFLSSGYGESIGRDYEQIAAGLTQSYQTLQNSITDFEHVVLWFEHDTYDQFILIFLLSYYHRFGLPQKLWMVTTNQFPGSSRFIGLGQLPSEGLALLWQSKQRVTVQQCLEADQHWLAFTDPDKTVFHRYVNQLTHSSLPYFKEAALRQLQEQPIAEGDLSLTEKLTVELLSEESPQKAGMLFRKLMVQKEPIPFLGDIMYWDILQTMEKKGVVQILKNMEHWPDRFVTLA
ncbi:DUF1835 domain-containing protein [Marinomonas sp. C2222]|uniref:DUF1835 domain-containing protein n=1 Tax=Marinomonas sargassi TaxID=2984494 RepID=A0ABT2YU19_9GAMM|nr:DUF1835 domain-containing protein [Marinomonas sargassi]MCV2403395.1 DUF1835 domain-containing protein [Marinomonas sargassi]